MPNWCNNSITLRHKDSAMVSRAQDALGRGEFLQEFIPMPEDLNITAGFLGDGDEQRELERKEQANLEKYGVKNWYDWHVREWGTKWDVGGDDGLMQRLDPNTLEASFDSAWAPPCAAYEKLCALGFEIKAYYNESGMAFCGVWEGNEEDCFDDYCEYGSETSKTVREVIGEELDDYFGISESMAEYEEENE